MDYSAISPEELVIACLQRVVEHDQRGLLEPAAGEEGGETKGVELRIT